MKKMILSFSLYGLLMSGYGVSADDKKILESDMTFKNSQTFTAKIITLDEKNNIFHLPQDHYHPAILNYNPTIQTQAFTAILNSQFEIFHNILSDIRNGIDVVVFHEELDTDRTREHIKQSDSMVIISPLTGENIILSDLINKTKKAFKTIPSSLEKVTNKQIPLFIEYGAVQILFYLGFIDKIYKSITTKDRAYLLSKLDSELPNEHEKNRSWAYGFKENKLKEQVEIFLENNKKFKGKIDIVFGEAHDLVKSFKKRTRDKLNASYECHDSLKEEKRK